MGKKLAATVGGAHKIGKNAFLTGEDLLHHKVKKAFLTKDGVHRLVFSSGTVWEKWSCIAKSHYAQVESTEDGACIGDTDTLELNYSGLWNTDYAFDESEGFVDSGENVYVDVSTQEGAANAVGCYNFDDFDHFSVWQIDSLDSYTNEGGEISAVYTIRRVAIAVVNDTTYEQGSDSYGTVEAGEGAQPESGEIIEHSRVDGVEHYVLKIGGEYYYYIAK